MFTLHTPFLASFAVVGLVIAASAPSQVAGQETDAPNVFDYDPEDHGLSASMAVMFRIDEPAAPHMGAKEPDIDRSLGIVDIWHWELDCGPGIVSGGKGVAGGDDPACNLDDEYSTKPENREDDGGGDVTNTPP